MIRQFYILQEIFDLARVNKSASLYDPHKLDWVNGEHFRAMSDEEFSGEKIREALGVVAARFGNGEAYWPLRVALSGQEASPGPVEIADVLGREETLRRIRAAVALL